LQIFIADHLKTSAVEAVEITADFNFGEPQLLPTCFVGWRKEFLSAVLRLFSAVSSCWYISAFLLPVLRRIFYGLRRYCFLAQLGAS
jgi:hypothetical protein